MKNNILFFFIKPHLYPLNKMSILRQTDKVSLTSFKGDSYIDNKLIESCKNPKVIKKAISPSKPKQKKVIQKKRRKGPQYSEEFKEWYDYYEVTLQEHMQIILGICKHPHITYENNKNIVYSHFVMMLYRYFNKRCDPRFIKVTYIEINSDSDPFEIDSKIYDALSDYYSYKRDYCDLFRRINLEVLHSFVNSQLIYTKPNEDYIGSEEEY